MVQNQAEQVYTENLTTIILNIEYCTLLLYIGWSQQLVPRMKVFSFTGHHCEVLGKVDHALQLQPEGGEKEKEEKVDAAHFLV